MNNISNEDYKLEKSINKQLILLDKTYDEEKREKIITKLEKQKQEILIGNKLILVKELFITFLRFPMIIISSPINTIIFILIT